MMKRFALFLLAALTLHAQQRVEVSRDLWISAYSKEVEGNNGGSHRLKLKGIQEFVLIDFDPAPLRGKKITKAQLHVHLASPEAPLRRTTVSTISQDWVEGTGSGYAKTPGASSFVWAKTGELRWGNSEPDITSVVCGEGGSLWGFGEASAPDAEGWQIIPILPEVAQARLEGRSHGFYVIDDIGNEYTRDGNAVKFTNFVNRYVSSREDKRIHKPYFTLWLEDGAVDAPKAVNQVNQVAAATLPSLSSFPSLKPTLPAKDIFGRELASAHFFAAKGETIGFSVTGKPIVKAPDLGVKLYSMPKVAGLTDPLVPGDGDETFIDLHVPKNTPAGDLKGTITVNGTAMPFTITVWNFTLPDRLSFLPQMNAYGLPGHARDYYRLAHEHRVVLNQLPYGWTGKVDEPAPKLGGDGKWDWTKFDAEFGPLLDGSAFADLPRGAVPVDAYYLLLNENWPMKHDEHFKVGYWIESAFDDAYWTQFRAMAAEIAKHLEAKGWTEPMFEFYLNNKVYFKKDDWRKCTAAWIFDEPVHTQDFWAIRHYGREFWSALFKGESHVSRRHFPSAVAARVARPLRERRSRQRRAARLLAAHSASRQSLRQSLLHVWQRERHRHTERHERRVVRRGLVSRRGRCRALEYHRQRRRMANARRTLRALPHRQRPRAQPAPQNIPRRSATRRVSHPILRRQRPEPRSRHGRSACHTGTQRHLGEEE